MSAPAFHRVKDALLAAREASAEGRARLLEALRREDVALCAEVEALLTEEVAPILATGALARGLEAPREPPRPPRPARVGPYRVIEVLGEGGMGHVYLAVRDDDAFRKEVALKLVRGAESPEVLRRFRSERQILATLEHPNIARLLDGGSTEAGEPYLVMEHVPGVPIDAYCDARRLPVTERIRLFREVCAAVHHAHRHLVVHRDIKPANVLVTRDGTPKLLDFGIAKVLGPDPPSGPSPPTRTGLRLLTPDYASPEQLRGEPVTTATDVHALGLLLFELLTGRRAYHPSGPGIASLERAVCEAEPERPSTTVVRGDPAEVRAAAAARGTTPERLRRDLEGDLDNIALLALRKEPERRYGSAQQLADDLERHLLRLPVSARRPTVRYRARKFVARHRLGVASALAGSLLLFALSLLHGARLASERDRAETEARKARQVSRFLSHLFEEASPQRAQGRIVTASDLLDHGVADLAALDDQPLVQAELLRVIGYTHSVLGEDRRAVELLDRALALQRSHGAPELDLADTLEALGISLRMGGRLAEAEVIWKEALEVRRRVLGPRHEEVADSLNNLGLVYYQQRRLVEARDLLRRSLDMHEAVGTGEGEAAADAMNNLGLALRDLGEYEAAEEIHRRSVSLNRRLLGDRHPNTAIGVGNLGVVLVARGRPAEALPYLREEVAVKREVFGDDHRAVAVAKVKLARALRALGRLAEARALLDEARARLEGDPGGGDLHRARALRELGLLERDAGRLAEAERDLRGSLEAYREAAGETSPPAEELRVVLAGVLRARGRLAEAEALSREVSWRHAAAPANDPRRLAALRELADVLTAQGRLAEAEPLHRDAARGYEAALRPGHPELALAWTGWAENALASGRRAEAVALLERALAVRRVALPEGHRLVAETAAVLERARAGVVTSRRSPAPPLPPAGPDRQATAARR